MCNREFLELGVYICKWRKNKVTLLVVPIVYDCYHKKESDG